MSGFLRSLAITFGVALSLFVILGAWYWLQFKPPAAEATRLLAQRIEQVESLMDQHLDLEAASVLDQIPYRVVVANAGRQALISNLATELKQRQIQGQTALEAGLVRERLVSPSGYLHFYYQPPLQIWDWQLLFPLIFGLLLGLIAALWDFLQRQALQEQADTLIMLSHAPHNSLMQDKVAALEQKNLHLREAAATPPVLHEPLPAKPASSAAPAESIALQTQVRELERELSQLEQAQQKQQTAYQSLQQAHETLSLTFSQAQAELDTFKTQQERTAAELKQHTEELTSAYQVQQELRRELEQSQARLSELETQTTQLHEAWQEIQHLRQEQTALLQKQESWQKDKQRVLALMHEKEEQMQIAQTRLKEARAKLHELSVAYKKQLETLQHLPPDLQEVREVLELIIGEKDQVERENGQLHIALADRDSEIQRLRKELEIRSDHLHQAQHMIAELGSSLHKNERELGLLSETLEDKLHDLDRIKDLHNEDQRVLTEVLQERDELKLQWAELQEAHEALKLEQAELKQAHQQLQSQWAELDLEAQQLELEQLRQSLQLTGLQQQRRAKALETLKQKFKEGEALYQRLKKHAETQEQSIRQLQQEVSRYRSEIQLLENKLALN